MESVFADHPTSLQFSPQEVVVLKEFVQKMVARVTAPPTEEEAERPSAPPPPPKPPKNKQMSPVLDALRSHGFDPNATIEERKALVKSLEKKK
jgi:hypothetical protein